MSHSNETSNQNIPNIPQNEFTYIYYQRSQQHIYVTKLHPKLIPAF